MKYVFGPVLSRRLGMSLGVDMVTFKTCTFDCVYCQLGVTTVETADRQAFVPKDEVLKEIRETLTHETKKIDFVTLSGSGEPTLNSDIGKIIDEIKLFTDIPIAVLTNGSLLYRADVRKDLSKADLVVPSLDAVADDTFVKVNRPCKSLKLDDIIDGLRVFTEEFQGKIWLEIMLVRGINDDPGELRRISEIVRKLRVDKIQLNTVVRPPAEDYAEPISYDEMQSILELFDDRAEVIVDFDKPIDHGTNNESSPELTESRIISLIKRHPCTIDDMSKSLGIYKDEIAKYADIMVDRGVIKRVKRGDRWYYEFSSDIEER